MLTRRSVPGYFATILVIAVVLAGCGNKEAGQAQSGFPPSLIFFPSDQPTVEPSVEPKPAPFVLGPLFQSGLDLKAGPVETPIELRIPSLKLNAAVLGVGLTAENVMDSPTGPIGDPVWQMAFWYRGGGIPGDPGTATIAGHVNDLVGQPEIFAHLQDLHPGDLIIIRLKNTNSDIRFIVNQTEVYPIQQSSNPVVLTTIFGAGPVAGTGPKPALDGLSHLTLITCAGVFINGEFDHRTVVYATRSD